MTLTSNDLKDRRSFNRGILLNREILLKGTPQKIISQEGGLPNFLVPLMKVALPLMKNVLTPLAKSILIPLGLTAAISVANAAIQRKIYVSGMTALIISDKEIEDIMTIDNLLKNLVYR